METKVNIGIMHTHLSECVITVLHQLSNFSAMSWREHITFDEMMMMIVNWSPYRIKPNKIIQFVFEASPLSMQH
jgi:hypothetical protein